MANNYTLADLRRYVRDLTGIYSYDIITDTYINRTINDLYFELAALQNWSWTASVPSGGLTSDSSYPVFSATYHNLLAFQAAAKILKQQGDDTGRADTYTADAAELISSLSTQDLQGNVSGLVDTYDNLVKFVRKLLDTYDNSLSTSFITNKLKEEYNQLNENSTWPWKSYIGFAADPTNLSYLNASFGRKDIESTATSTFNFAKILAYGTAAKLALIQGKADLGKVLQDEFDEIFEEMTKVILHGKLLTVAQTVPSANDTSLSNLVELTKQLTADHTNNVPPMLIQQWLIEEASNLTIEKDWEFRKTDLVITLPAGVDTFVGPSDDFSIIAMFIVNSNGITTSEIKHRSHLFDVTQNSSKYFYQQVGRNEIKIGPVPQEDLTIYFKMIEYTYLTYNEDLTEAYTLFTNHFRMILPYRVAIKALAYSGNNPNAKNLIPLYQAAADNLYDNMINYYNGENNLESFQLGAEGIDVRKYMPFFRIG